MKNSLSKFALVATLGFALALTISCSSDDKEDGGIPSSNSGGGVSSPGGNSSGVYVSSSSSVTSSSGNGGCGQTEMIKGPSVSYGDEIYESVVICGQTWMARNLNYEVEGSLCSSCSLYGMRYDWVTAMALDNNCKNNSCVSQIDAKHRGICPPDWHIPTNEEWNALVAAVGGKEVAGKLLKAKSGWLKNDHNASGNGTDDFGFSALPGGACTSSGMCVNAGVNTSWWSATQYNDSENKANRDANAWYFLITNNSDGIESRYGSKSQESNNVRCVKDQD